MNNSEDTTDYNQLLNEISKHKGTIELNKGERITDVQKFVNSHSDMINSNTNEDMKRHYKLRIIKAYEQTK